MSASEQLVRLHALPTVTCAFASESVLVAAGYDMNPMLLQREGEKWAFKASLSRMWCSTHAESMHRMNMKPT